MADIFLSYARDDRNRMQAVAGALRQLGWDVWADPDAPRAEMVEQDTRLSTANAVIVLWSQTSRYAPHVNAEAARGLYRDKLIQIALDKSTPPRPFDQVQSIDLSAWSGSADDPSWQAVLAALSHHAGAPGMTRVKSRSTIANISYATGNKLPVMPIAALALIVVAAGGVWWTDPFHWRGSAAVKPVVAKIVPAAPVRTDPADVQAAWKDVDQENPDELRKFVIDHPGTVGAETAASLVKSLDAQAWVAAVDIDTESAYAAYLDNFPDDASIPGANTAAASDRLASIGAERQQAVAAIQKGLVDLRLYGGKADGRIGDGTVTAARVFAQQHKRGVINLKTASPRQLRQFADTIAAEAGKPAPPSAADDADKQRVQQAQAAAVAATPAPAAPAAPNADVLAAQQLRAADEAAWTRARAADTAAAYQDYLRTYPQGAHAVEARSGVTQVNSRAASFGLDSLPAPLRAAVQQARLAQTTASARAASARLAAARADGAAQQARQGAQGTMVMTATTGDRYEGQALNGGENGVGVRSSGAAAAAGDRYRGEVRNGVGSGLGVYEFASNSNNAAAGALRYEGEHSGDRASGLGVTYWRNGESFSGEDPSGANVGRGVMSFSNGMRYEGEMRGGMRNGYGVVWSTDGQLVLAGRWRDGDLVEPSPGTPLPQQP